MKITINGNWHKIGEKQPAIQGALAFKPLYAVVNGKFTPAHYHANECLYDSHETGRGTLIGTTNKYKWNNILALAPDTLWAYADECEVVVDP